MLRSLAAIGLAALLLLVAAPARAALVPFTGALEITIHGLDELVTFSIPGGGIATVNGSGGLSGPITHLALPAAAFSSPGLTGVPLPNDFPVVLLAVRSVANQAAVFSPGQPACGTVHTYVTCSDTGVLHGRSGLDGSQLVGIFGTFASPSANLTVPLSLAGTGTQASGGIALTHMVTAAGWTSATATIFNPGAGTTATAMGGTTTTPDGARQVNLVSPLHHWSTQLDFDLPSFYRLQIVLPEPGGTLLVATGALGLAVLGWRRRRR